MGTFNSSLSFKIMDVTEIECSETLNKHIHLESFLFNFDHVHAQILNDNEL